MAALDLSVLATPAAGLVAMLLDAAVKGTAILLLTAGLAFALGRAAASTRHFVWTLGLGAVLLLPALSLVAPRWEVPLGALRAIGEGLAANGTGWEAAAAPAVAVVPRAVRTESADATQGAGTWRGARGTGREAAVAVGADAMAPRAVPPGPPAAVQQVQPAPAVAAAEAPAALPPGAPRSASRAERAAPRSAPRATRWPLLVALFWLAGALPMGVAIVASIGHARRLARRARPLPPGRTARMVRHLSARLGLPRPVTVLEGPRGGMPITWGAFRPVVLLPAEAAAWDDDQLRAVLLHELAHVKRHDYLTQLLARTACAVFWFNPLVWVAAVRLRVERELACDDVVLSAGSRASDYAGYLLEIARSLKAGTVTSVASIAMARPSQLSGRLLAVLDADRPRSAITRRLTVPAWGAALCVALPLAGATAGPTASHLAAQLPAVAPVADAVPDARAARVSRKLEVPAVEALAVADGLGGPPPREGQLPCRWGAERDGSASYSASYSVDDDDVHIRIRMGDCRLEIDAAGRITFNEAETDVVDITPGGYFEIEEREGRSTRRMEMQPAAGGGLQRRWIVNGQVRWTATGDIEGQDAEATAWLARLIPEMFRRTGFQAEERARRILQRGGVDGLLTEVAHIPSDHAERKYLTVLLTEADLSAEQLKRVVEQATLGVSSDFELAELLIAVAQAHPVDEAVLAAYVAAAGTISSDYEHRRVLAAILSRPDLSRAVADAMLQSASAISSDYELAELLIGIVEAHPIDRTLTPAFFAAVNTIESDFEHRRVLRAVLSRGAPSLDVLDRSLETAVHIGSDFELAELLVQVAKLYPVDQELPANYLAAVGTIQSDFESRRAWQVLVGRGSLTPGTLRALFIAGKDIESDFELAELLIEAVEGHALDATTRPAFFEAVSTIGSDYEQARVLKAVAGGPNLDEATVEAILQTSLQIASDHELATLLVTVAQRYRVNDTLRPAFLAAANTLNDYERGRVMNAVFPRGN